MFNRVTLLLAGAVAVAVVALSGAAIAQAGEPDETLQNALRVCNAHASGHEAGHPDVHTEWHRGYEICAKIEPSVRRMLAPKIEALHREQAAADHELLERASRELGE